MVMKKGIAKAAAAAIEAMKANSQKVNGSDDIARVGTVSSGDETIGKLIAEAMEKVGHDGVITLRNPRPPRPPPRSSRAWSSTGAISPPNGTGHREDGG